MMKTQKLISLIGLLMAVLPSEAMDDITYLTFLTTERGYTEITRFEDLGTSNDYYYILTAAEDNGLIVGIGTYENKPGWASSETKALRYRSAGTDPMLERSNYFTIEKNGSYVGLRNIVYSADMFQTHKEAGFMYVNTYTDKALDEWSHLIPTFKNGYWLFESGKYPISEGDYYSGYLGPWNNEVKEGEAIALNRKNTTNDAAGHYRIFRIAKTTFEAQYHEMRAHQLLSATADHPVDATWLITNPSFESGDNTGWHRAPTPEDDREFTTREYPMTNKEGGYLFNAYQYWAPTLSVSQTAENIPSGIYELSAVVATWEGREVTFSGNFTSVTKTGIDDATGIPVSIPLTITGDDKLTISAISTAHWWDTGHESEDRTFFKLDDIRLTCQGLFLDGKSLPLPNDKTTLLTPNQWYYYDVSYPSQYLLKGNPTDMVYTTDGYMMTDEVSTLSPSKKMTLDKGRFYFMTTRSDATLRITPERETEQATFTATALNVDGLPQKILGIIEVNKDGPGSDGTKLISQYLTRKGYDIIGVSEDFNYDEQLQSALSNNYDHGTWRGGITGINYPFDTDGLNLYWKKGLVDKDTESWTQWTSTTPTEANQYVRKGFRHYEMTVAGDMIIDVYVLHMDAGDATSSRHIQWEQLASAILNGNSSRPKLVMGDTNSRWTREEIKNHFTDLLTGYKVSDAWVELCRNNQYPTKEMNDITNDVDPVAFANYEVVDKILYINPKAADTPQLTANSFWIENDYTYGEVEGTDNNKALGDHKPVVVEFTYVKSGRIIGDVNRDGEVTIADILATISIILGNDSKTYDHQAADMNHDDIITMTDAMAIVEILF